METLYICIDSFFIFFLGEITMKSMQKLGGVAAMIEGASLLIMMILFITVLGPAGMKEPSDWQDPAKFLSVMHANSGVWFYMNYIRGFIISPFMWVAIIAIHQRLRPHAPDAMRVTTSFGAAAAFFWMFAHLVGVAWTNPLIEQYARGGADGATAAQQFPIMNQVWHVASTGGMFFTALWILSFSVVISRSGLLPKWLGYFGVVVGLVSLPSLVMQVMPSLPMEGIFFLLIGWSLFTATPMDAHAASNGNAMSFGVREREAARMS
jgi:hypothetical protein